MDTVERRGVPISGIESAKLARLGDSSTFVLIRNNGVLQRDHVPVQRVVDHSHHLAVQERLVPPLRTVVYDFDHAYLISTVHWFLGPAEH